jgi:hypothetical protein
MMDEIEYFKALNMRLTQALEMIDDDLYQFPEFFESFMEDKTTSYISHLDISRHPNNEHVIKVLSQKLNELQSQEKVAENRRPLREFINIKIYSVNRVLEYLTTRTASEKKLTVQQKIILLRAIGFFDRVQELYNTDKAIKELLSALFDAHFKTIEEHFDSRFEPGKNTQEATEDSKILSAIQFLLPGNEPKKGRPKKKK